MEKLSLESLLNGLRMVSDKLVRSLEQLGVTHFPTVGQAFDPEKHDALTTANNPAQADDTVLLEHLKGYCMGERVIRHAQVVVNKLGPGIRVVDYSGMVDLPYMDVPARNVPATDVPPGDEPGDTSNGEV
jgi:hypothetical protein